MKPSVKTLISGCALFMCADAMALERLSYNYSDIVGRVQTASGFSVGRNIGLDASTLLHEHVFVQFGGSAQFYDDPYAYNAYIAPGLRFAYSRLTDFYVLARVDGIRFEDDGPDGVNAGDIYARYGGELGLRARYSKIVEWGIGAGYTSYADGDLDYGSVYGAASAVFRLTRATSINLSIRANDVLVEPGVGFRIYWDR